MNFLLILIESLIIILAEVSFAQGCGQFHIKCRERFYCRPVITNGIDLSYCKRFLEKGAVCDGQHKRCSPELECREKTGYSIGIKLCQTPLVLIDDQVKEQSLVFPLGIQQPSVSQLPHGREQPIFISKQDGKSQSPTPEFNFQELEARQNQGTGSNGWNSATDSAQKAALHEAFLHGARSRDAEVRKELFALLLKESINDKKSAPDFGFRNSVPKNDMPNEDNALRDAVYAAILRNLNQKEGNEYPELGGFNLPTSEPKRVDIDDKEFEELLKQAKYQQMDDDPNKIPPKGSKKRTIVVTRKKEIAV